jgi:hypothetical protein
LDKPYPSRSKALFRVTRHSGSYPGRKPEANLRTSAKAITFATRADEEQWIATGGAGAGPPDPSDAECFIQGDGWAATVGGPDYGDQGSVPVIRALGGRVVNG